MNEPLRFRLEGVERSRRLVPVRLSVPTDCARPELVLATRRRPVACQLERTPDGVFLWFLLARQQAGEAVDVTVTPGARRRSPRRMRTKPSAAGIVIERRGDKVAEYLAPVNALPTLTLFLGGTRILVAGARSLSGSREPNDAGIVSRSAKPVASQGAVFAKVAVSYQHLDRAARVHWIERFELRVFNGPEGRLLLDFRSDWFAVGGRLAIGGAVPIPSLSVQPISDAPGDWLLEPGWRDGAIENQPGAFARFASEEYSVGVLAHPGNFGFAPRWTLGPEQRLEARASIGPTEAGVFTLPVGGSISQSYRLALFCSRRPLAFARQRYLEFAERNPATRMSGPEPERTP